MSSLFKEIKLQIGFCGMCSLTLILRWCKQYTISYITFMGWFYNAVHLHLLENSEMLICSGSCACLLMKLGPPSWVNLHKGEKNVQRAPGAAYLAPPLVSHDSTQPWTSNTKKPLHIDLYAHSLPRLLESSRLPFYRLLSFMWVLCERPKSPRRWKCSRMIPEYCPFWC